MEGSAVKLSDSLEKFEYAFSDFLEASKPKRLTPLSVHYEERGMGEIIVDLELENFGDRLLQRRGYLPDDKVRRLTVQAIVDTGAVMLVLPQDVVSALGLETQRTVIVAYADERKEERPVAGAVTLRIGNRLMTTECIVGPPLSEPLIGQVILEELDLLADCQRKVLVPRPESPHYPLLKLK